MHLLGQEAASVIDSCTTNMMKAIGRQDFSNGVWTSSATESHYLIANSIKPKRIVVPRSTTIFLLLVVVIYFGLLLIYTFNTLIISGFFYLSMIPISAIHYFKINKNNNNNIDDIDHHEDVL